MDIDALFKFYYRPLCLYALHYLKGGIDQAEDIVQDCFVRMWEHQPRNPKAFLYAAVRNACIDRLRKANPFLTDVEPADLVGTISDEEAQERSVDEAELWTAIDSLPSRCREIFLMSKRDGMRYREIAEELGLSEKTVEHQIAKALSRLRGMRGDLLFTLFFM
ncbi:MAG: sigma-70 family RNA polymerase sigma factor [Prevotella sp.]|nr:sigma-70 family RNA polymerase sigma factor [Prevotella sp.]